MSLLVLTDADVSATTSELGADDLLRLMARVFHIHSAGQDTESPQRLSIISPASYSALVMPSYMRDCGTGIKIVALPRQSGGSGLPATTLVLNDHGAVEAVVNARRLTALRTAAGSALATRLLGPKNPEVLLAFGAGAQVDAHIRLFLQIWPSIRTCAIVNRSRSARLNELRASLVATYPSITFVTEAVLYERTRPDSTQQDLKQTVSSADIICTATPSTEPLFNAKWVKSGAHINLVGSYTPEMQEVEVELIRRAGRVVVDSAEACLSEAGELIRAKLPQQSLVEIGGLLNRDNEIDEDAVAAIKSAGDITIFKSVGIGVQDIAIARYVISKARERNKGSLVHAYDEV